VKIASGIFPQSMGKMGQKRQVLYTVIAESPGLHFRELQRRTQMATGQLLYHLHWLEEKLVLRKIIDGQYLRYYTLDKIGDNERKVLEFARQKSVRHILLFLIENDYANHESIVKSVGLSPSTVSWHLKKLVKANMLVKVVDGRKSFYYINDLDLIKKTLMKYRVSFLDKLVDSFIEMWDE
jgi:predicted transcriptional regulator